MSRIKRWLAAGASAALLMGLGVPATSYADDAVAAPTNHAGACEGDTGVTMVVDYQDLGGGAEARCFTGDPADGIEALEGAGFTLEGTTRFGKDVVCRLNNRPAVDEIVPIEEDPAYTEDCSSMPPSNGYWSYWQSDDKGASWDYSQLGIGNSEPAQGAWEGWSFSLNATASTNPEPRTNLALAGSDNAASATAAADWIASKWDADATHYSAGLADDVLALAAAEAHPAIISEMVQEMTTSDPDYYSLGADSLAKMLIALDATGQDTNNFLGCDRDLTAELDKFIADDDRSLNNYWGPHLVTMALNRLDKEVPQNVWDLLIARQQANGGFSGFSTPEPDDTGLGLMALVGVSQNELNPQTMRDAADAAIVKAIAWANNPANQKTQDDNYYWATFSPANSTGILGGALADAGEDISSPQAFMRAQQKLTGVGAWSNKLNGTRANGMGTNQGIYAVAGKSYATASFEVDRPTSECSVKPAFTTQPASTTVTAGQTATFTVAATGVPTPGITWEQDINGTWTPIKDVTGTTLTLDKVGNDSNGLKVRAVAANAEGNAVSEIATLTVTPVVDTTVKPAFTTQPASTTVTAGQTATFTVVATGDPTPGITWERDINGAWTAFKDVTGPTLTLDKVGNDSNGLKVRAVAANGTGYAVSNIATLTVKPVVTTPPVTTPPVTTPSPTTPPAPSYPEAIYTTPGYHKYNGRNWFTSCEPYSVTQRCRTQIQAKTVSQVDNKFVTSQKWVFNNLTYLPAPRSVWNVNKLANTGSWTADDGRKWRTECGTPQTGRNGCRSWTQSKVIDNIAKPGQPVRYGWVTKEVFNNIVKFS